ncbi:TPA: hypothetical protein N0F65_005885, partial [Lagenidium giganteum]
VGKARYRFSKAEIETLVTLFGLIAGVRTREGTKASGGEALYIVLHKLAAPVRWIDLTRLYGRSTSGMSNIFTHTVDHIDNRYRQLRAFNHEYAAPNVHRYADAIFDVGGSMQNVWAFIDGTVRGICRPKKHLRQQSVYNGHKNTPSSTRLLPHRMGNPTCHSITVAQSCSPIALFACVGVTQSVIFLIWIHLALTCICAQLTSKLGTCAIRFVNKGIAD